MKPGLADWGIPGHGEPRSSSQPGSQTRDLMGEGTSKMSRAYVAVKHRCLSDPSRGQKNTQLSPAQIADLQNHELINGSFSFPFLFFNGSCFKSLYFGMIHCAAKANSIQALKDVLLCSSSQKHWQSHDGGRGHLESDCYALLTANSSGRGTGFGF